MDNNDLTALRQDALAMGGPKRIEAQHAHGKLTARERLDTLLDPDSFEEYGLLGRGIIQPERTPADGVVCGIGRIDGRSVALIAYDFTVLAGTIGATGEAKATRIRERARVERLPLIWLIDSAGARVQEVGSTEAFTASGALFYEQVALSGVVPQVAAVMGPGVAGTAYIPALTDLVIMVKGTSSLALGGPPLVKATVGEDISMEELGGSRVHTRESGVGDLEAPDDPTCLQWVRQYLSYFPSHHSEAPPRVESVAPDATGLDDILPEDPRRAYDMREILRRIVDADSLFEIKPKFARNIVVALARLGGQPVGIVASQPSVLSGAIDNDAADKATRFVELCDAFGIPLVFFQDVPGFLVGSRVEKAGIIRHGAKLLFAVSRANVPKLTVIVRKAYGAGYYVMCGRAFGCDLLLAWPTAEISLMGAEGVVEIAFRREVAESENPEATKAHLLAKFKDMIDIKRAAEANLIDDLIEPGETRERLIKGLQRICRKQPRPSEGKHGVRPV